MTVTIPSNDRICELDDGEQGWGYRMYNTNNKETGTVRPP